MRLNVLNLLLSQIILQQMLVVVIVNNICLLLGEAVLNIDLDLAIKVCDEALEKLPDEDRIIKVKI